MLHRPSKLFDRLHEHISGLPVIDCHEHMAGPQYMINWHEPITALIAGYFWHDLVSAGANLRTIRLLQDSEIPTEKKWPLFKPLWERTEFTAYARITKIIMKDVYNVDEMSLDSLKQIEAQLSNRDQNFYWSQLDEANIRVVLADVLGFEPGDFGKFLSGEQTFPDRWRLLIPLPLFHVLSNNAAAASDWERIQRIGQWADHHITSLDEFLEAVFIVFKRAQQRGAIGLKDQCAYNRTLHYDVVARADAERLFNRLLADPRTILGWPDAKPLDDYLFHQYMRFARELDMPVQIHTGHMAGNYNRVDRANVQLFSTVLELHQDVRFDLFHGNWPFDGDILFFNKNYPNVSLDLCWMYIIDPMNAEEMLKRSVMTAPHCKVNAFGGDFQDHPEYSIASLKMMREIIAAAFTDLVERGWLTEGDACRIAADWLFHNPNKFFKLNLLFDQ